MREVRDIRVRKGASVNELIEQMSGAGGFTAKKFADAIDLLERMLLDERSLNFLSFPACVVATGTRGVLREFIRRRWFDVVITTCGTLDHDISRCFADYYHGSFEMNDVELHRKGINRLGNVLIPNRSHGVLIEEKMAEFLPEILKPGEKLATYEFCWEIGKKLDKGSIAYWCWRNRIPMIIPGITDGAVGYHLWLHSQGREFGIDVLKDEQLLNDLVWRAKRSGALIIGGGISKHHTIWWNMFKGGLDRVVYLSTAVEWDGSLSGARPREAISWGKVAERAKHVTVEGDATLLLPVAFAALLERLPKKGELPRPKLKEGDFPPLKLGHLS